jgi:hypothetical protein
MDDLPDLLKPKGKAGFLDYVKSADGKRSDRAPTNIGLWHHARGCGKASRFTPALGQCAPALCDLEAGPIRYAPAHHVMPGRPLRTCIQLLLSFRSLSICWSRRRWGEKYVLEEESDAFSATTAVSHKLRSPFAGGDSDFAVSQASQKARS